MNFEVSQASKKATEAVEKQEEHIVMAYCNRMSIKVILTTLDARSKNEGECCMR